MLFNPYDLPDLQGMLELRRHSFSLPVTTYGNFTDISREVVDMTDPAAPFESLQQRQIENRSYTPGPSEDLSIFLEKESAFETGLALAGNPGGSSKE